MKKLYYFAPLLVSLFFISCEPQDSNVSPIDTTHNPITQKAHLFGKTFGSNVSDLVTGARQSIDGGIVVCGYTIASAFGDNDIFVTKMDTAGNIVWSKIIGGSGNDQAASMDTTLDGGFIICGSTNSFSATNDPIVIKIDNSGNLVWTKYYSWTLDDIATNIQATSDYGYILTGSSNSFGAGGYDAYALKIDASGGIMWCRAYGGAFDDYATSIKATQDQGYIIGANTASFGTGGDIYIIKAYGDGGLNWSKSYGGILYDNLRDIVTVSGGYVICGSTASFGVGIEDAYVFSIDNNGFLYWSRTFGGALGEEDRFYSMRSISAGGIILSGTTKHTAGNNEDVSLLRLFSDGAFNWEKTFGGIGTDISTSVAMKNDGGLLVAGYTSSFGSGANDAYILSLKSDGTSCLPVNSVTPNGGSPQTNVIDAATVYTDVNSYETNSAPFNMSNFVVTNNTQCIQSP